jgi:hypothetical protein
MRSLVAEPTSVISRSCLLLVQDGYQVMDLTGPTAR